MSQRSLESKKEAVRGTEMKRSQAKIREVENAPFSETSPSKKMKAQQFRSATGEMSYGFEIALAVKLPAVLQKNPSDPTNSFDDSYFDIHLFTLRTTEGLICNYYKANREVSVLFSKYSEVLRERATVDASQLGELEDILTEARSLESHLKEKKEHLRRSLALISDKLQG